MPAQAAAESINQEGNDESALAAEFNSHTARILAGSLLSEDAYQQEQNQLELEELDAAEEEAFLASQLQQERIRPQRTQAEKQARSQARDAVAAKAKELAKNVITKARWGRRLWSLVPAVTVVGIVISIALFNLYFLIFNTFKVDFQIASLSAYELFKLDWWEILILGIIDLIIVLILFTSLAVLTSLLDNTLFRILSSIGGIF